MRIEETSKRYVAGAALALVACTLAPESQAATESVVYAFKGGTDGSSPQGGLLYLGKVLYGTTIEGGTHGDGTVFKVNPSTGAESLVHSFNPDDSGPWGDLIKGLYGNTFEGTMFKINRNTGKEKVLSTDGTDASSGSLVDVGGTLYGITGNGGGSKNCNAGCGTVISINTKTRVEKILYAFQGGADGALPQAGLLNVGGILYGTTSSGGAQGAGTLFSIDPNTGAEQVLYSFCSLGDRECLDGYYPIAGLINVGSMLYGTTEYGGPNEEGTVFSFNLATRQENVLYSFCGQYVNLECLDGWLPVAGVVYDAAAQTIYGTTLLGGTYSQQGECSSGCGTVFSVNLDDGTVTHNLYNFQGGADGIRPLADMIDVGGVLYGTTQEGGGGCGGDSGCGTVFKITLR